MFEGDTEVTVIQVDADLLRRLEEWLTTHDAKQANHYHQLDKAAPLLCEARERIAQMAQELSRTNDAYLQAASARLDADVRAEQAEARGDTLADTARAWERQCADAAIIIARYEREAETAHAPLLTLVEQLKERAVNSNKAIAEAVYLECIDELEAVLRRG